MRILTFLNKKYLLVPLVFIVILISFLVIWLILSLEYHPDNNDPSHYPSHDSEQNQPEIQISETKTYHNKEFGFEFEYPDNWILDETYIYGNLRKFHLASVPLENERLIYDNTPPIAIDVVIPERAERLVELFYEREGPALETIIDGIVGLRYEYEFDRQPRITIVLPLGQYRLILNSDKKYEDTFAQMVATFKFLNVAQISAIQRVITFKTYRNEEFGFEFEYPDNWLFYENTSYSPFSKFNLIGSSPELDGYANPIIPSLLVNIVTPDFVERQFFNLENIASKIIVQEVEGLKYEYKEKLSHIAIILPLGEYKMILGTHKGYEDIFNQVLDSFKFLK